MQPNRLVAVDPGVTTGLAIYEDSLYTTLAIKPVTQVMEVVLKGYITAVPHGIVTVGFPNTLVVLEDFNTAGAISEHGLHTVRLIGAIEFACHLYSIPLILQFPGERKKFIEQAKDMLVTMKPHFQEHDKDALAHLLLYQWRKENNALPVGDRRSWANSPHIKTRGW